MSILVINKYNRKFFVEDNMLEDHLKRGCRIVENAPVEGVKDLVGRKVLIHRWCGGLGDIVTMQPAILGLMAKSNIIGLVLPEEYHFIFENLGVQLLAYQHYVNNIERVNRLFDAVYDFYCPAGLYEASVKWNVQKGRIRNFCEYVGVEPRAPKLESTIKKEKRSKKKVLIIYRTKNISKDVNPATWKKVVESLPEYEFTTLDFERKIEGVDSITDVKTSDLVNIIANYDLVVGGDTGAMHVASALGVKTLWLFGPTNGAATVEFYKDAYFIQGKPIRRAFCMYPCYYSEKHRAYKCNNKEGLCMKAITNTLISESITRILR